VRLEVLDWGGNGRPVFFIGGYLTDHAHDAIAPKLTDRFHVYALTRRGIGASDHPQQGYDPTAGRKTARPERLCRGVQRVGRVNGGGVLTQQTQTSPTVIFPQGRPFIQRLSSRGASHAPSLDKVPSGCRRGIRFP
jgi:hypothetical protein